MTTQRPSQDTRLEADEEVAYFHLLRRGGHPDQLHVLLLAHARQPVRAVAQDVGEQLSAGKSVGGAVCQHSQVVATSDSGGFVTRPWRQPATG